MRFLLGGVLGIVAACGGSPAPKEPVSSNAPAKELEPVGPPVVATLRNARDQMCTCNQASCAHAAYVQLMTWHNEHGATASSEADAKAVNLLLTEYGACAEARKDDPPTATDIPLRCEIFGFEMIHLARCDKFPEETRTALLDRSRRRPQRGPRCPRKICPRSPLRAAAPSTRSVSRRPAASRQS